MTPGLLFFILLGSIAVIAAVAMLVSKNSVYSALFLVMNFLAVAIIYLILGAPFIALAQIAVYAAIMVLILFVIMLLGTNQLDQAEPLRWQRPLAIILGLALLIQAAYALITRYGLQAAAQNATPYLVDPQTLGLALYKNYSLPFEITSVILLVAAVGAVILTHKEKKGGEI